MSLKRHLCASLTSETMDSKKLEFPSVISCWQIGERPDSRPLQGPFTLFKPNKLQSPRNRKKVSNVTLELNQNFLAAKANTRQGFLSWLEGSGRCPAARQGLPPPPPLTHNHPASNFFLSYRVTGSFLRPLSLLPSLAPS